jgi:hypothetical protein
LRDIKQAFGAIRPTLRSCTFAQGTETARTRPPEVIMSTNVKLIGIAVALTAALGGFEFLGPGESNPAIAAPVVVAYAAPPAQGAVPGEAVAAQGSKGAVQEKPYVDCTKQVWPYVLRECLAAASGTPVRNVTRTIAAATR